jgi:WD40 repeat protein
VPRGWAPLAWPDGLRHGCGGRCVAFSPDGALVAVCAGRPAVRLFATAGLREAQALAGEALCPEEVAFAPDGRLLAVVSQPSGEAALQMWSLPSGRRVAALPSNGDGLAFSPDGRLLATVGHGLRLHDGATGRLLASYAWHAGRTACVAFAPEGRWLATGADDGTVKLWPLPALLEGVGPRGRRLPTSATGR